MLGDPHDHIAFDMSLYVGLNLKIKRINNQKNHLELVVIIDSL